MTREHPPPFTFALRRRTRGNFPRLMAATSAGMTPMERSGMHFLVEDRMKRLVLSLSIAAPATLVLFLGALWLYGGSYAIHTIFHGRGYYWVGVKSDDPDLSPSVQRALRDSPPAFPGKLEWQVIREGFEAGELAVIADGAEADRIFLARIAPAKFRFEVRNEPSGDLHLDAWMTGLGAAAVINGSYYARNGTPA